MFLIIVISVRFVYNVMFFFLFIMHLLPNNLITNYIIKL